MIKAYINTESKQLEKIEDIKYLEIVTDEFTISDHVVYENGKIVSYIWSEQAKLDVEQLRSNMPKDKESIEYNIRAKKIAYIEWSSNQNEKL